MSWCCAGPAQGGVAGDAVCGNKKPAMLVNMRVLNGVFGLPGGTRTPDLQLRRLLLYPVELRAGD